MAAAQEPAPAATAPPAAPDDHAKKKEDLKALLEARDKETKEYADAVAVQRTFATWTGVGAAMSGIGAGMVLGGYLSKESVIAILSGCGVWLCGTAVTTGVWLAGLYAPDPRKEAAEVDAAQKKIDDAAMAF